MIKKRVKITKRDMQQNKMYFICKVHCHPLSSGDILRRAQKMDSQNCDKVIKFMIHSP